VQLPEPKSRPYMTLLADIEKGLIKIPQFQRDFVWSKERAAGLIDSILKGYPIGTFITWKTKETLRVVKNLGGVDLPLVPDGDFAEYVLDGQQRLTSLYCALKGVTIVRGNKTEDFAKIYVNLNATEHDQIVVTDISVLESGQYISLTDLLNAGITVLVKFDEHYHQKLEAYRQTIQSYNFSLIEVKEAALDVATEIFTRINVGGKALTLFEIMVAKTFDSATGFDLNESFETLIDRLSDVGYDTISSATVLQTLALVIGKECKRQNILRLDKKQFIQEWPKVVDAIEAAVDYLKDTYRIPVSKLLPYNSLLAPMAYFFYHHKDKPEQPQQAQLADFFWRVSLGGRYSSAVEGRLAQDIKRIDKILQAEQPEYDWAIDTSVRFIKDNGWFSTGRSYIKALLCIMAYQQPVSFNDGAIVNIRNDWLKQANSRNYHHYFPKAFLKKQEGKFGHSNHIANITIVDEFLNKRKIGARAPSDYMAQFKEQNTELAANMTTHLIELDNWGIWDDDYVVFFRNRCEKLAQEIKKRLILREQDKDAHQSVNFDDIESIDELTLNADL
jgi:hypothetical protein